jgi:hypothetical protein
MAGGNVSVLKLIFLKGKPGEKFGRLQSPGEGVANLAGIYRSLRGYTGALAATLFLILFCEGKLGGEVWLELGGLGSRSQVW